MITPVDDAWDGVKYMLIDVMDFDLSSAFWRAYPNANRGTLGQGVNGMEAC